MAVYVSDAVDTLEEKPGRVIHIAPGAQVADDDCCDGQLSSRIVNITPNQPRDRQAQLAAGASLCGIPFYIVTIELAIRRCAAVMDDDGTAPLPGVLEAEGLVGIGDMAALLQAISCNKATRSIGQWIPYGPQGGCSGGAWTFTIRMDNCISCEPAPEPDPEDGV